MIALPNSFWPLVWSFESDLPWHPSSDEEIDRFIRRVTAEDLLTLLNATPVHPPALASGLRRHRALVRAVQRRGEQLHAATVGLCRQLSSEQFILMKGADYRYRLYSDPTLRPMRDIDVLVPIERIEIVGRLLEEQGLRRVFPGGAITRVPWHHERTYVEKDFAVDLHHSVIQRSRNAIDYQVLWRDRVQFAIDGVDAWHVAAPHALVLHCVAMAKDEYVIPLIRYVDLWLMLHHDLRILEEAARLAALWKCRRAFYCSLELLTRVFPEARDGVAPAIDRTIGFGTRRFLNRWVLPDPARATRERSRPLRLWRKANLHDSPYYLITFAADHVRSILAASFSKRVASAVRDQTP